MAVYNRYRGNGSRAERIEEPPSRNGRQQSGKKSGAGAAIPAAPAAPPPFWQATPLSPPAPPPARKTPQQSGLPLQKLPFLGDLPKKLGELETEDLLLILILYLMYRESGDKELLIIMGAMYLL